MKPTIVLCIVCVVFSAQPVPAQTGTDPDVDSDERDVNFDELQAGEEFAFGVRAYHEGFFEDAIQNFLRSLSLQPDEDLTREWLGRAYYRVGLEQAARDEWNSIASRGNASEYLQNRLDRLELDGQVLPDAAA
ncbi:MAG: tetratricopeptide repeat protein, partial [Spirochaetota bacterium]